MSTGKTQNRGVRKALSVTRLQKMLQRVELDLDRSEKETDPSKQTNGRSKAETLFDGEKPDGTIGQPRSKQGDNRGGKDSSRAGKQQIRPSLVHSANGKSSPETA